MYGGLNLKIGLLAGVVGTTYRQWGGASLPPPPLIAVFAFFSVVRSLSIGLFYGCICCLLLCFPQVYPSFSASFNWLCLRFRSALLVVCSVFAGCFPWLCGLFAPSLSAVCCGAGSGCSGHWLINHIGQYSERPGLTLFGLDVCAVWSCSALLSGRCWFRAVL